MTKNDQNLNTDLMTEKNERREAFEHHLADLTGTDYDELKAHFNDHERIVGDRYSIYSDYETKWNIWKACWQSRQADIDEYKMVSESIEDLYLLERKKVKAVEQVLCDLKESMTDFKEMDLYDKGVRNTTVYAIKDLEKALRGVHE
ncbi:hypothetical protein ACG93R_08095 [Acinetobacter guillouiae]|uniref:hypothetical protein n=1 Tax=Acinetobacter guillouiae TaxID=106649 RepID=UPI003AF8573A